jgi:formylglycine-generating enzyme required for sulfatase activity
MVGNVWEWTHSRFVKYPYIAKDGREDEASRDSRVLRGGSFSHFRYLDRCACRNLSVPDYRYHGIGFRVCVSPITSL